MSSFTPQTLSEASRGDWAGWCMHTVVTETSGTLSSGGGEERKCHQTATAQSGQACEGGIKCQIRLGLV